MIHEKEAFHLAAMGDVMLDREVGNHIKNKPEDFLFNNIRSVLKHYDVIFMNLENPIGTKGTPHLIQDPQVTFCCHPDSLQVLKNLGADIVSLGNNHMLDYGETALCETLEHLDALGIKHVGAGRNYKEANRPLLMECNSRKIAFLSHVFVYSASTLRALKKRAGVSDHRIRIILAQIRRLKSEGYTVVVSIHWGMEYSFHPIPYQVRQARRMIENGASLILGHGPHFPQGIETYRDGQIVYSLGNFIFDEPYHFANRSFIYGAEIDARGKISQSRIHPVHIINHVPRLVGGPEKRQMERIVNSLVPHYSRKPQVFRQKISSLYFSDIIGRVSRMRSMKFLFLPPPSFYFDVGIKNYLKKVCSLKIW